MSADIVSIEKDLRDLWKDTAEKAGIGAHKVLRSLTLNLLVRTADSATADYIGTVIQQLTSSHPHRAIVIIEQPDLPQAIEAWVQANCLFPAPGVPQVCGEQITIDARGNLSSQIASLILPLLVTDLPVFLWMPGPAAFQHALLPRLRNALNRLLVDSADFTDPQRDIVAMADFVAGAGHRPEPYALSDLNWARLTPWRELTAQFFDTRPLLPHLRRLDVVDIEYLPAVPGSLIRALLLAGWLISSLGWEIIPGTGVQQDALIQQQVRRQGIGLPAGETVPVTINLRPVSEAKNHLVGLASLHMRATDNVLADFSVSHIDDASYARTLAQVEGQTAISRLAHTDQSDLPSILATELRLLSRDHTFGAALRTAGDLARQLS